METMATYIWDNSLSVGNNSMDDQHKELFRILNSLDEAIGHTEVELDVNSVIEDLEKYVTVHFKSEEALMSKASYSRLDIHVQKHDYFIEKIAMLKRDIEHGRPVSALDLLCFLAKWLRDHIMTEDKQYEEAVKGL
jgi:hemerythrin